MWEGNREGNEEDTEGKEEEVEPQPKEGGGEEDVKAGCLASLASTPVQVKVARIQRRIQAEKEEEANRKVLNKEGRKEGPTGKRDLKQPTLSSFLSIKSRLEGPVCQRKPEEGTSGATSQGEIGKGPLLGTMEGRQQELGEGRDRPRSFIKGSPEHNLLQEAGVLKLGEGCVPGSG